MPRRDYSQHHRHGEVEHRAVKPKRNTKKIKQIFWLILILIILLVILYSVFFSGWFEIKKVSVSGSLQSELIGQTEGVIADYLSQNKAHILFLSVENLEKYINSQMEFASLEIAKKWPNKLEVKIDPETPAWLWQRLGNRGYFLVDREGVVETQINLDQVEWDLPLVKPATTTDIVVGKFFVSKEMIDFVKNIYQEIQKEIPSFEVDFFELENTQTRKIKIYNKAGWYVLINLDNNIQNVVHLLKVLLVDKFNEGGPAEYVDLRLEDKIFYK